MSADDMERRRQTDELRRNVERQAAEQKRQQAAAQSKKETDDWVDAIRRGSRVHDSYSGSSGGYSSAGEDHPIVSALRTIFAFIVILFVIGIVIGIASYVYPPLGNLIAPFTDPIWIYLGDLIVELNPN